MQLEDNRGSFHTSISATFKYAFLRFLRYELMSGIQVLKAFIRAEFKSLPGSAWVDRGRYSIMNSTHNRVLNELNWTGNVAPGTTVTMSMLLQQRIESSSNPSEQRCPVSSCSGSWTKSLTQSWATWYCMSQGAAGNSWTDLEQ